jgi:ATP-dependent HslUV protease ATP-binding subunit HslU
MLVEEESKKMVDRSSINREAIVRAEQTGIIFIDEIDKVAIKSSGAGPDVSREGVQRDLLPIIEGSTVQSKFGPIKTDHILFIAAGAFHIAKPSDLIPELQGRLPIRVELESLTRGDLRRILQEPKNALVGQYFDLLKVDGVEIEFTSDALDEIAELAEAVNEKIEDIGARRLHTMMERLLEEALYEAPETTEKHIRFNRESVRLKLDPFVRNLETSRNVL